jgi:superfamily I DNA/RNA helicase
MDLIATMDVSDMAVVSFSKAAAAELTTRSQHTLQPSFIGTIHSFCFNQMQYSRSQVVQSITDYPDCMPQLDKVDVARAIEIGQYGRRKGFIDLEVAYGACTDLIIPYDLVETVWLTYTKWKDHNGYIDFDDMLVNAAGHTHQFRTVIVDEAQDLSNLQWDVVRRMVKQPDGKLIVAGDDDQAIFTWAGANPHGMVQHRDEQMVLKQSYRVPLKVFQMATKITGRMNHRVAKDYKPAPGQGYIASAGEYDPMQFPFPHTIMCRDRYVMRDIEEEIMRCGIPYVIEGNHGPGRFMGKRAKALRAIRDKDIGALAKLKHVLPTEDRATVDLGELPSINAILFGPNDDENEYLARVIGKNPEDVQITLSTIHAQKGKEFDHGVLIAHCSPRVESMQERAADFDDEMRVWYTAITRVKKGITIVGSNPYLNF